MASFCVCGAGSFSHADEDPWLPSTPTGGSKRRQGGGSNPYSTRGLEKFSMLLADLETRREKIMAATGGSQGVALVQFVHSGSGDWVPIVVRPREPPPPAEKPRKGEARQAAQKRPGLPEERPAPPPTLPQPAAEQAEATHDRAVRKISSWNVSEGEGGGVWWWRRPSHYLPVAVALVLLCLAAFGRTFAICAASICWYSVPVAAARGGGSGGARRSMKKDYGRRASERNLGPAAGGVDAALTAQGRRAGGLEGLQSPRRHHANMKRGSW